MNILATVFLIGVVVDKTRGYAESRFSTYSLLYLANKPVTLVIKDGLDTWNVETVVASIVYSNIN